MPSYWWSELIMIFKEYKEDRTLYIEHIIPELDFQNLLEELNISTVNFFKLFKTKFRSCFPEVFFGYVKIFL